MDLNVQHEHCLHEAGNTYCIDCSYSKKGTFLSTKTEETDVSIFTFVSTSREVGVLNK